jgi:signal transduction histidine kinase
MTPRNAFLILLALVALLVFASVERQLSMVSYGLAANRESQQVLRRSLDDQKALALADPAHRDVYRRRFEETRRLLTRLEIMALTRRQVMRQFELALVGLVAIIVAAGVGAYFLEQRSRMRRLARVGDALQSLSMGDTEIVVGDRGRDVIGRIAKMIEETSGVVGRERQRMRSLEHLSAWQEAARRHAHEMRTPLTAAHLEIRRFVEEMKARLPEDEQALGKAEASILEELEQLRQFTNNFVAIANVGSPKFEVHDVARLIEEFCTTFAPNWPQLRLHCAGGQGNRCAAVDREMLRRVLVNLCNNSALAAGERGGEVTFSIGGPASHVTVDVADDGPGVAPDVRRRIFEPYTTTRKTGEGMGLGLAISKKILLDHGGDLAMLNTAHGAAFRLTLPSVPCRE